MFSGNTAFLVASPTLQDYLVDKTTGEPLSAGIVTFYQDQSRQTLKNVYYQQGIPGNYTYTALPNPLTLSAVGTIQDNNGNDVIPFFYPIDETNNTDQQLYYVAVYNSSNVLQFTRQGFPFVPAPSVTPVGEPLLQNYLYNNVFWRNTGANNALGTNTILAPGSHDGFVPLGTGETINGSQPSPGHEIRFIKSKTGATDQVSYSSFGNSSIAPDVTPEYYLNLECTAATTGENYKMIQFPVQLHVNSLSNVQMIFSIWAQGAASGTNTISIYLYQFLGIGAASQPAPVLQGATSIQINTSWTQYQVPVVFTPLASNLSVGNGGDDAWYLQIWFPTNATFNINITKPSLFLGSEIPVAQYTPYDQIDSVIGTPRTGDVRISTNSFFPYGWVAMNNGTIGNASSNATARGNIDTWPLYHLLWNLAQPYDTGSGGHFNPICQMYTSGGSTADYSSSAYADFNGNKALQLTSMFGRVLMGTVPVSQLLSTYTQSTTGSNSAGNILITVSSTTGLYNGQTVTFVKTGSGALPDSLVANAVYYITNLTSTTFNVATSFANYIAGTVVAYGSTNGSSFNMVSQVTGSTAGEYLHSLLTTEMPPHTHTITGGGDASSPTISFKSSALDLQTSTGSTGGSTGVVVPHNNIQPATFYNIYIKL